MVKALHAAGIEVILDVVYNHTAEGNHIGPDAVLPRHRQRRLLPAGRRTTSRATTTHRLRQHAGHAHPHVLQLIMDSLRYWVPRCTSTASASTWPRRWRGEFHEVDKLSRVLRPHPAGPGAQPGQADRRALGHRRRRLPGRQLPAAVDGVERQVPRHRARLLARRARAPSASSPRAFTGSSATSTSGAARRRSSLINFVTATTASRCATWCPTTRSTTRPTARATATARATTESWNCGVEGPTDDPEIAPCAAAAAQPAGHPAAAQGVPMLAHGDELGRTQGGNNNAYCQDNEISWVDWDSTSPCPTTTTAPAGSSSWTPPHRSSPLRQRCCRCPRCGVAVLRVAPRGSGSSRPARRSPCRPAASSCCAARCRTARERAGAHRHISAAAARRLRLRGRGRAAGLPRRPGRQPSLPQPDPAGRTRLDPRL
jgi:isoamylase